MRDIAKRNAIVKALLDGHLNQAEVARQYGLSRERIRQYVANWEEETGNKIPINKLSESKKKLKERIIQSGLLGSMPDHQVADEIGGSNDSFVRKIRRKFGIFSFASTRPLTCPSCLTKPYARGLCKNCYTRDLRKRRQNNA